MERKFKSKNTAQQVQLNEHLMFRHGDSDDDEEFEETNQKHIGWRSSQASQLSALQQLYLKGISMKRNQNFNKIRTQNLTSLMFHNPKPKWDLIILPDPTKYRILEYIL
ncbi:UNKNOWN [Stylonychia lemnae]|uniref:Uncharacterized protein n=1 Tax=Stylonychia lemnae TaxID=5949 RepID=A0A078B4Y0_STYLE|nr:UNKNOWN [Stylonychia lemnae]|eukprot:CDW89585.1 UNKNOWN [Stylonychia lemnae]